MINKCPRDTDGDGDCAYCVRLPGGCPVTRDYRKAQELFHNDAVVHAIVHAIASVVLRERLSWAEIDLIVPLAKRIVNEHRLREAGEGN